MAAAGKNVIANGVFGIFGNKTFQFFSGDDVMKHIVGGRGRGLILLFRPINAQMFTPPNLNYTILI